MDYEKAYKKILELVRKELQACGSQNCDAAKQIFRFFHELRENEDERIRNLIIDLVNARANDNDVEPMISWLEKQGEQKHADKVEPKFKIGDWIACKGLNTALIINIDDDKYEVEFIDGNKGFPYIAYVDRNFHLWTIQDAKDGDVLVASDGSIFLFKIKGISCISNSFH